MTVDSDPRGEVGKARRDVSLKFSADVEAGKALLDLAGFSIISAFIAAAIVPNSLVALSAASSITSWIADFDAGTNPQ
jgi:hypothetical protein